MNSTYRRVLNKRKVVLAPYKNMKFMTVFVLLDK